ncbi:hypothetical protein GLOTRDRAFT_125144 [Gloeophyllum trabeum ATCC 11539]|uniref:Uncharacterized protein n=1 Tax=Gloeophyllum trabeum (strain ATCC 11539 / FP-39264 / Madison 617) TaxID=670483 RepID=S7QHZ2_GLOTA|nr:uncharacterized protein GLOTRDRAFT_125144 [Gloeophyllum trabeum ATCC 11539]EPQ58817.1 hypothetical protein GLOTRDRAFT_125144 [Gloeophyllum trabeum ATCC 11539]
MSSTTESRKKVRWSSTVKPSPEEVEAERKRSREVAIEALEATPRPSWVCYDMVYGYPVTSEWVEKAAKEKGVKTDDFRRCADCVLTILRRKSRINELELCAPKMYATPPDFDNWLITFGADHHLQQQGRWPTLAQIEKVRKLIRGEGRPIWVPVAGGWISI